MTGASPPDDAWAEVADDLRVFLDTLPDQIWFSTPRFDRVLYSTKAFESIYEMPLQRLYEEPWSFLERLKREDRERLAGWRGWDEPFFARRVHESTVRLATPTGKERTLRIRYTPLTDDQGRVRRIAGITEDVSDRAWAEREIDRLTLRLTEIIESTTDAIFSVGSDWRFQYVNRAGGRMLGAEPPDLVGRVIWDAVALRGTTFGRTYEEAMRSRRVLEVDGVHEPSGRWFENRIFPADGGIVVVSREITERKIAERREERHQRLLDHEAVIVRDLETDRVQYLSHGAERLYGVRSGDAVGRPIAEVLAPDYAVPRDEIAAELRRAGRWAGRARHLAADGSEVFVDTEWNVERGIAGSPASIVEVDVDVTAQVEAERRAADLATSLHRAERLDALGRLAGGIAHDLGNLAGLVLASLETASAALDASHPASIAVADATRAAERASALSHQLRVFARGTDEPPRPTPLDATIVEMASLLERTVGAHVHIRLDLTCGQAPVLADPTRIEQLVLNLVINARDAMPDGGTIDIGTAMVDVPAGERAGLAAGRYVRLTVADDGAGMPPETASRAFDPFFTTSSESTGLGLATVYGIATGAGGTADLASVEGAGTRVVVWLPVVGDDGDPSRSTPRTVLFVENGDRFRTTEQALTIAGHEVETTSLADAGEVWSRRRSDVEMVVLDPLMEGGAGVDLLRRIQIDRPDVPIVLVSGRTALPAADVGDRVVFVDRPFSPERLLDAVRMASQLLG